MDPAANAQPEMSATSQPTQPRVGAQFNLPPTRSRGDPQLRERMSSQEATMAEVVRQLQELREMFMVSRQQTVAGPSQPAPPQTATVAPTSQIPRVPTEQVEVQDISQTAMIDRQGQGENAPHGRGQPAQAIIGSQGGTAGGQTAAAEGTGESQSAATQQQRIKEKRAKKIAKREQERKDSDSFHRMNLPTFSWGDSIAAEDWLDEMEKAFKFLNCSNRQRVQFASYKLVGEAHRWWATQERGFESLKTEVTWDVFKEAFFEKFFPSTLRMEKAREFAELQQGSMSVTEYETKFSTLIRFAPKSAADDDTRRKRFEDGLAESIRIRVQSYDCSSYGEAVKKALYAEREFEAMMGVIEKRKAFMAEGGPSTKKQAV